MPHRSMRLLAPLLLAIPLQASALTVLEMDPLVETMAYEISLESGLSEAGVTRMTFVLSSTTATSGFIAFDVPLNWTVVDRGRIRPNPCPIDCAFTWSNLAAGVHELVFDLAAIPSWVAMADGL